MAGTGHAGRTAMDDRGMMRFGYLLLLLVWACRAQTSPSLPHFPLADTLQAEDSGAIALPPARFHALQRLDTLWARLLALHYRTLVFDGHVDTPTRMVQGFDFGRRHRRAEGHVDLPRMFEGGLDAAFFSIYVPAGYGEGAAASRYAFRLIEAVQRQVAIHADSAALAYSAADLLRITRSGRKAILLGLEGGHALAGSIDTLWAFYAAGIRYVTLTHVNTNRLADASQDRPSWNGLSEQGRRIVREMNRLGMLIDLSHTSDATFFDVLAITEAPVILSHSSMRSLVPTVRNASDEMLRALAQNGGVVLINFFDALVNPHLTADVYAEAERRTGGDLRQLWRAVYAVRHERNLPGATLEDVLDHIDHAVQAAGIDHVGLGSDFDGVFDLPTGLEDVTRLPWITYGLYHRGYSEADIQKILGGNLLRVLVEVERTAARLRAMEAGSGFD